METAIGMSSELTYSSAIVSLVDRDSQSVKKAMLYPITRIELLEFEGDSIRTVRTFVVDEKGHWVEAQ